MEFVTPFVTALGYTTGVVIPIYVALLISAFVIN